MTSTETTKFTAEDFINIDEVVKCKTAEEACKVARAIILAMGHENYTLPVPEEFGAMILQEETQ